MSKCREMPQEMFKLFAAFSIVAERLWGKAEYKYHALPIQWVPGKKRGTGSHSTPITGRERYECTEQEWRDGRAESDHNRLEAFLGRFKRSYTSYQRTVTKDGWRETLIKLLQQDTP